MLDEEKGLPPVNNGFVLNTGFMISLALKIVRIKHNVQTVLRIGAGMVK